MKKIFFPFLFFASSLLAMAVATYYTWQLSYQQKSEDIVLTNQGMPASEEAEEAKRFDKPDEAMKHEFAMTRDPFTNRIPRERLAVAQQAISNYYNNTQQNSSAPAPPFVGAPAASTANYPMNWTELGPNNVGGRTRALWVDLYNNNRLWAGGVGGGLWKISNVTATTPTWTQVSGNFSNMAVTAIAQNPTNKQHLYIGTGEGWYNFDAIQGGGIYKSSNYGSTWSLIAETVPGASNQFDWKAINKIVVAANGDVYVATQNDGIL